MASFLADKSSLLIFFGIFMMLLGFFILYILISRYPKIFWTVLITSIFVGILILASSKYIYPRFRRFFTSRDVTRELVIYDTDPRNDEFIKGSLSPGKMRRLDHVLLKEKNNDGLRLSTDRLNELTQYDNEIIEAYNRWRKCKDMRRSHHHVIYPDERHLYYHLR